MNPSPSNSEPTTGTRKEPLRERLWSWLGEHQWMVIGGLWVVTLAMGYIGIREEFAATNTERSGWDPLYRALQLFVMDDSMVVTGPIHGWKLEVARFVAPLISGYTAVVALLMLFHEQAAALLVRFARGHVVLCGLGGHGMELAQDLRRHQRRLVVIEINPDNEGISACRQAGITVLVGDATDEVLLKRARLAKASRLVALTGDDGTNVEVAVVARRLLRQEKTRWKRWASIAAAVVRRWLRQKNPAGSPGLECLVHVTGLMLRTLLSQHPVFGSAPSTFEVKVFNVYDSSVRLLFARHPLDGAGIAPGAATTVHLVLIGCGRMGESVVLHAVRTGHFANGKKLKVTIIDRAATAKRAALLARYPGFECVCDARFIEGEVTHVEILRQVTGILRRPNTLPTVVVAFDNDSAALACALQLRALQPQSSAPILIRISEEGGLAALFEADGVNSAEVEGVRVFGAIHEVCTDSVLLDVSRDRLAKQILELRDTGTSWRDLGPWQRDSYRQQADQLAVSVRALGRNLYPDGAAGGMVCFTPPEAELLAKLEHARWRAERLLEGWRFDPGPENPAAKLSPWLRPWEQLPGDRQAECVAAVHKLGGLYQEAANGAVSEFPS